MTNRVAAVVALRQSEQFKRATCSLVSMFECALIVLALWSAHANVFTAVGLAFAAGMMLVILFMLIVQKSEAAQAAVQPEAAVAPNAAAEAVPASAAAAAPMEEQAATTITAVEPEAPKTIGNGSLPVENANGSLPLEHEPPVTARQGSPT